MLNRKNRKEAVIQLEETVASYNKTTELLTEFSEKLYFKRQNLKELLSEVERYVNTISNKPKVMNAEVKELHFTLENYQEMLNTMQEEISKSSFDTKASVAAGAAAGVGVAAFGPSVAMGIATTFGTASTGTAISTLTGAAASKAALAWLGGGALVAGGKGIAGGTALLGLAGPLGWTIGGATLLGSGLLANANNKKRMGEAKKQTAEISTQEKVYKGYIHEVKSLINLVERSMQSIRERLTEIEINYPKDYLTMNEDQKYNLGTLVNMSLASLEQLNRTIGEK